MIKRKILFATDLSAADKQAFDCACRIAKSWNAILLIVHVERPSNPGPEPIKAGLDHQLFSIFPTDTEVEYEHILRHGDPALEILDLERKDDVHLIVLSTHGRKGIQRMVLGSVAEQVMREAQCPVMTIRRRESEVGGRPLRQPKILVPVDFSIYSYAAFDFGSALADSMVAELTVVHADDTERPKMKPGEAPQPTKRQREIWRQINRYRPKQEDVNCVYKVLVGSPKLKIAEYAESGDFDFVVLGTHGRTGIGRALLGSVAEQVVRNTACPVITVKPSNKRDPVLHYQTNSL